MVRRTAREGVDETAGREATVGGPSKPDAPTLREQLIELHRRRKQAQASHRRPRRLRLTPAEREAILAKTGGKCHICGGDILGDWHTDHVLAHSAGGQHAVDNYLPAHPTCNNYRWDYLAEEFELILKLGVWARTQIERGTPVGRDIEARFTAYEAQRIRRRRNAESENNP